MHAKGLYARPIIIYTKISASLRTVQEPVPRLRSMLHAMMLIICLLVPPPPNVRIISRHMHSQVQSHVDKTNIEREDICIQTCNFEKGGLWEKSLGGLSKRGHGSSNLSL